MPYVAEQEYSLPSASLAVLVGIFSNGSKIPFFPPQFVSEVQPKRLPCDMGHASTCGRFGCVPWLHWAPRGRFLTLGTSLYSTPSPCPESLTLLDILILYWVKIARIRQFHRTDYKDKNCQFFIVNNNDIWLIKMGCAFKYSITVSCYYYWNQSVFI